MTEESARDRLREVVEKLEAMGWKHDPKDLGEPRDLDFIELDREEIEETIDVIVLIREEVERAVRRAGLEYRLPPGYGKGRPTVGCEDLAKAVLVQQYFRTGYRKAARLVAFFKEILNVEKSFSYKTIERAYGRPRVEEILEEIHRVLTWTPHND